MEKKNTLNTLAMTAMWLPPTTPWQLGWVSDQIQISTDLSKSFCVCEWTYFIYQYEQSEWGFYFSNYFSLWASGTIGHFTETQLEAVKWVHASFQERKITISAYLNPLEGNHWNMQTFMRNKCSGKFGAYLQSSFMCRSRKKEGS